MYLEGRYTTSKALFLDSTRAHAVITPAISLTGSFTIAFWMKYTSDDARNATILHNFNTAAKEFILKISGEQFIFQRTHKLGNVLDVVFDFTGWD